MGRLKLKAWWIFLEAHFATLWSSTPIDWEPALLAYWSK
jgi:hypothetical protein